MSYFKIPKVQLIITLLLIYLTSIFKFPTSTSLYLLIACVSLNVFFDLLFTYLRKRVFFTPYAAIASGLIMALIINQSANLLQIIAAAFFAMGLKNFLRPGGRHIFNPVASGLFLAGLIFGEYIGWWGVSFQTFSLQNILFFLILMLPGLVSILRLKKHYSFFSYILISSLASQLFFSSDPFSTLLNPSILFFALVMLPEPMTSPVKPINQTLYGAIIALIPFLFALPLLNQIQNYLAFDPLLFALLLANLMFFRYR
ncbi:RnfABCDGE type electron transport complex subunit D [Candidatus Daviesbacteria bacterium]|nr:RnfABCDGE type electron transport complex subunit D [Candidatus Daviesbacteria bacterium]